MCSINASHGQSTGYVALPSRNLINSDKVYFPNSGISQIALVSDRIGISYTNQFMIKDMNTVNGFGVYNNKYITIGGNAVFFGNGDYNISTQSIQIAKKIEKKLSIGVEFTHTMIHQPATFNSIHQYNPSIGISFKPNDKFMFSSAVKNIALNNNSHTYTENFYLAISYFVKHFSVHGQLYKSANSSSIFTIAGEYSIANKVAFLLRLSSGNELMSFGMEYKFANISIACSFAYNNYLGVSPECTLYRKWE